VGVFGGFLRSLPFGAASLALVKTLQGFSWQRRGAGTEPRAGRSPSMGEYPPFAMRFLEALEGRSSESGDKGLGNGSPSLWWAERANTKNCRPTRAAH